MGKLSRGRRKMIDTGNTAWMLTSAVLVLLMTLPGLPLFYAGLVQSRNALSVLMHCIVVACVVSLLWFVIGYTLAFDAGGPILGGLSRTFLLGMARDSVVSGTTIPESVYCMFQMTFAIITPGLIIGAYVERIHFPS